MGYKGKIALYDGVSFNGFSNSLQYENGGSYIASMIGLIMRVEEEGEWCVKECCRGERMNAGKGCRM